MSTAPLDAALSAVDVQVGDTPTPPMALVRAKVRALLSGYHARWIASGHRVMAVESLVTSDLWNPASERRSRSFTIAGRLDTVLEIQDRRLIVDHKTTSEDISDPNAPYWRQLAIEGQASHYMLLEWLNGRKADGALWDVVRKPSIRPSKLSKADLKTVTMLKSYCGWAVPDDDIAAAQATERETLGMYEIRLANDCITERPQWYFQRRPVPRLDADLHEYATELWAHSQEMLHARREKWFARNSGACLNYRTPCKYLGICSGHDTPDSENWQIKTQVHNELPELAGDGRDVLTNSRIRMFQTCRRKEYYAYQLGIERLDEEEREALIFGSVFHAGLAAWFNSQKEERTQNEHNSNASSVGAIDAGNSGSGYSETVAL